MITHRNRALLALLATIALLALMAPPALAHHRAEHDGGNTSTEDSTTEEEVTDERAGKGSARTTDEGSTEDSSTQRTTSQREPEPDPSPSQAPEKTTGPSCQPYSDQEGGTYDHDYCDNSQGMHGSGGNGKCAGCTGKADDKSPGGQARNDRNNGYECDNNGGVGKGNPAHARCPVNPPTNPPGGGSTTNLCPPGTSREGLAPLPNGSCEEKVRGRIDLVCPAGTDRAGKRMDDLEKCDDNVLGGRITNPVTPPLGNVTRQEPAGVLPQTGGSGLTAFVILGMVMMLLGGLGMHVQVRR